MKHILLKETPNGTELYIDGTKIDGVRKVEISKDPSGPVEVNISGVVLNEVQVET